MKQLGYGKGYEYAHDAADAITGMDCLPERSRAGSTTGRPAAASRRRSATG